MKTIYSLVTKPINQNVAIIRISGPDTFSLVKKIIPNLNVKNNNVEFHKINYDNKFIDDALVLTFISPNSFTGENVVEFQTHGSMFVVKNILSILHKLGAVQSTPGEFTKQAYMNGKIDLTQSEAINTLILSENSDDLSKLSLKNLNGEQTNLINRLLEDIGEIVANIQVSIDFPENTDLPKYNLKSIGDEMKLFANELDKIINDSRKLIKYSKGIVISIVGVPNAGKSTLLNSISQEERAIVSNEEGTTRDIVESTMYLDGVKVTFQDTAGIRKTTLNKIEKIGIEKAYDSIELSDIVINIFDGTKSINRQKEIFKSIIKEYSDKIIEVISKSDIKENNSYPINISAKNNDISDLLEEVKKFIRNNIFDNENNNALLITQNQVDNFSSVLLKVKSSISYINQNETSDIVLFELETAMKLLGSMIGEKIDQDYMDNLFAGFCIGK